METTTFSIKANDAVRLHVLVSAGLGMIILFLISTMTVKAQGPVSDEQLPVQDKYYLAYYDPQPDSKTVKENPEDRISFSNDGKYYVVRKEEQRGPNFGVQAIRVMTLRPAPVITDVRSREELPEEISGRFYSDRYQGMSDFFNVQFFLKLSPELQNELYFLVLGHKGFGVYDYSFNDRNYRTTIITRCWKMNIYFNKNGEIKKVARKSRGKSENLCSDFVTVINSVRSCSAMK